MKQNKFYFKGMIYTDEETFWKATREWPTKNTDYDTFFSEWNHLGYEIWMNTEIRKIELSNGALSAILEENFHHIIQKIFDIETSKKESESCSE